ncbi:ABC transporter substrate-binding protein [Bacillus sp. SL00103]
MEQDHSNLKKEWKQNDRIVLEKNEDYWQKDKPKLKQIIFPLDSRKLGSFKCFETGEIDLMDGVIRQI